MKFVNQSCDPLIQSTSGKTKEELLTSVFIQIERAGRTCYKSEDKITDGSAMGFVQRMIDSHHYAMLEHGTIYLSIPLELYDLIKKYQNNEYSKVVTSNGYGLITTNYRVIIENGWEQDLQYMCSPTKHIKRTTFHFICSRTVTHEFVRHRKFSFAQESTRYCNYTKGKFGNELTFITPCWETENIINPTVLTALQRIEDTYFDLINDGYKPQQAAIILPNALKADLIMTGFDDDWQHFIDLRSIGTTGAPHPQAKEVADKVKEYFNKL